MSARQIPDLVPGSAEWLRHMSASKIAAVVRLSPYQSKRALWDLMAGRVQAPEANDAMRRGLYLEDGIAAWYADRHPDYHLEPGGTWVHGRHAWATANPDRLVYEGALPGRDTLVIRNHDGSHPVPDGLLQIKTTGDYDGWGPSGTEEIPIGYRAQVMWEMDVVGVPWCDVAALLPNLAFREYRIAYDPAEAAALRSAAEAFMDSLDYGEPPELDGDDSTYQSLRKQNPHMDYELEYPLSPREAAEFAAAKAATCDAEKNWNLARARMTELMGRAQYATYLGDKVAIRKAKNGGTPWVEAAKPMPDMTGIDLKDEA